jgi:hypothetical protein
MGSTISIVVAVVAVVVGFLVLRNINDDNGSDAGGLPGQTTLAETDPDQTTTTTSPAPVTTTTTPLITTGANVVVANASGAGGSAKAMSDALTQAGFTTVKAANAAGAEQLLDASKVYFLTGADQVAASVARAMGGIATAPMPAVVPVQGGDAGLSGATVLVMLGKDLANKPLPLFAAPAPSLPSAPLETTTTTTAAPAG